MKRLRDKLISGTVVSTLFLAAIGAAPGDALAGSPPVSHARIFTVLEGQVVCGVAQHGRAPASELLCSAASVLAPKQTSPQEGDPGFVFLSKGGRPHLARLSQYSWQPSAGLKHAPELGAGRTWSFRPIGITCTVSQETIRCANRAGHGLTIGTDSYAGF
jgi:hypothetical protein